MSDEVVLELLRHLGIVSNSDETLARLAYELERQRHTTQPAFEQLAVRGMVLSIWGTLAVLLVNVRSQSHNGGYDAQRQVFFFWFFGQLFRRSRCARASGLWGCCRRCGHLDSSEHRSK